MSMNSRWRTWVMSAVCVVGLLGGCSSKPGNIDPLQGMNRFFYDVNNGLDRYVLKPAADGYVKIVPKPIRTGLGNAFDNLIYGNVIVNDFLQGKWEQGFSDTGRMAVNSTIGIAGIFDVASRWGMPAHTNSFGTTLGRWGSGPGPYLVLPLFGPSSVRDAPGIAMSMVCNPVFWISPPLYVSVPLGVTGMIDARARADVLFRFRDTAALDPYVFTRDAYLQYREAEIHGHKEHRPEPGLYDDEEMGPATVPSTQAAQEAAAR